jgi:pathogenesis-related protein 1
MQTNPGKSFANGLLCLCAGALLAACGGGSDSPGLSAVSPGAPAPAQQTAAAAAATVPAAPAAPAAPDAPAPVEPQASAATPDAFQQVALDAHNEARAGEGKGLASLKWSANLQTDAQAWADQCKFDHSVPTGQGQNLYMTSASTANPDNAVKAWMGEKADYTYGATGGTCAKDKACGHYTQVIWSTTTEVGCGVKTCGNITDQGKDVGPGTVLVCNYSPPGNFTGLPPYPAP